MQLTATLAPVHNNKHPLTKLDTLLSTTLMFTLSKSSVLIHDIFLFVSKLELIRYFWDTHALLGANIWWQPTRPVTRVLSKQLIGTRSTMGNHINRSWSGRRTVSENSDLFKCHYDAYIRRKYLLNGKPLFSSSETRKRYINFPEWHIHR